MTIFWIFAAGLLGLASLFVALPLLKRTSEVDAPRQDELNLEVLRQRLAELDGDLASGFLDQGQYDAARLDLERELLYDLDGDLARANPAPKTKSRATTSTRYPVLALALVLLLSAGVVLTYLRLGEREIIPRIEAMAAAFNPHANGQGEKGAAPLDVLVEGLAERMEKNPENLDGWLMLGRTYFALGQAPKALDAMEHAHKLAPEQPDVTLAYAQALAANSGNRLEGRPAELIRVVLDKEPGNPTARWLDGMLAYQQGRFADAAGTWQGLLDTMDPAAKEAQQLHQLIGAARSKAGLPMMDDAGPERLAKAPLTAGTPAESGSAPMQSRPATAASTPQGSKEAAGPKVQVAVNLDPAISAQAAPGDAVFVYARAAAGPPMPLAVQRLQVSDLPVSVTLDDSMAVMPAMRLSAFPQVVVGARVSKSGQATPQAGDLEGQSNPIAVTETPQVSVTIDRVRP